MTAAPPSEIRRVTAQTRSADDTRALASALAPLLEPGDVVLLVGDLGAGKTTFVQGLASGLGVAEQVTSPTFTLVRPYACAATAPRGEGPRVQTLLHADLYRVERLREVTELALGESVEEGAVAVVEWGDVGAPVLGEDVIVVHLAVDHDEVDDVQTRWITFELPVGRAALADPLARCLAPWVSGRS